MFWRPITFFGWLFVEYLPVWGGAMLGQLLVWYWAGWDWYRYSWPALVVLFLIGCFLTCIRGLAHM